MTWLRPMVHTGHNINCRLWLSIVATLLNRDISITDTAVQPQVDCTCE